VFHEPSSTCTNFSVGESSYVCAPATQILTTPPEIHEQVLGDGAPKGTGQTTPHLPPQDCKPCLKCLHLSHKWHLVRE